MFTYFVRSLELRSCVKREVGLSLIPRPIPTPSLTNPTVSVDVKYHDRRSARSRTELEELCEQGRGSDLSQREVDGRFAALAHNSCVRGHCLCHFVPCNG